MLAILLHSLFIVVQLADGNDSSLRDVNSNGSVMITTRWHQDDCMTRNCLFGDYYATSSANESTIVSKNHQIHLAVLLPSRTVDEMSERSTQILATTLPVIEIAIAAVKEKKILEGYELVIHHRDTQCSSTYGPMAAFDLYNRHEADVFLGPICDYVVAPVARYAGVWELPVLTTGGLAAAFNHKVKQEFDTLAPPIPSVRLSRSLSICTHRDRYNKKVLLIDCPLPSRCLPRDFSATHELNLEEIFPIHFLLDDRKNLFTFLEKRKTRRNFILENPSFVFTFPRERCKMHNFSPNS